MDLNVEVMRFEVRPRFRRGRTFPVAELPAPFSYLLAMAGSPGRT